MLRDIIVIGIHTLVDAMPAKADKTIIRCFNVLIFGFFIVLAGCAVAPTSGCKTNGHATIVNDCFFCQSNLRYWEMGCVQNKHWNYNEDCQSCLEKAHDFEKDCLRKRQELAEFLRDLAEHYNNNAREHREGRRKQGWDYCLEGFEKGLKSGQRR